MYVYVYKYIYIKTHINLWQYKHSLKSVIKMY